MKDFEDEDLIEDDFDDFDDLEETSNKNVVSNKEEKDNTSDWRTYNVKEKNKFAF